MASQEAAMSTSTSSGVTRSNSTRSRSSLIDLEIDYPVINNFNKCKLPTNKDIIGLVKKFNESKTYDRAIHHVSDIIWKHWKDSHVYPTSIKCQREENSGERRPNVISRKRTNCLIYFVRTRM